jgi:hypothetical protein
MFITHSYAGMMVGSHRYLFFALYEDYNDIGRDFVREFDIQLERLARTLGHESAVVRPFLGDIERTREHVLGKDWRDNERDEIVKVPALLVLTTDFDAFSPRHDPWLLMHFGERRYGDPEGLAELTETFRTIGEAATAGDLGDLFEIARGLTRDRPDAAQIFRAQPGVFGFSVDLVRAGTEMREWLRGHRRRVSRTTEH